MPEPTTSSVPAPGGARVIALMNQKGGVGKTTTTVNLAAGIAELGRRVLVIDLDPQAHASIHLGVDPAGLAERAEGRARSVYDLLWDPGLDPSTAVYAVGERLSVMPAETDLAGIETELSEVEPAERVTRLRRVLAGVQAGGRVKGGPFDYVMIDCPPSLGVLTLNGLAAAGEVLIPMQAHFLALQGVSKLLETVKLVGRGEGGVNPGLKVAGVVLCMHDPASTHVREVVKDLEGFFAQAKDAGPAVPWSGAKVYSPPVRRNIKLAECPSFGQTIFQYAPFCPGALDYKALAERFVQEWDARTPAPAKAPAKAEAPAVTTRRTKAQAAEAKA